MKSRKWPLIAALSFATVFLIGCGDDKDPRLSDADALCLKMIRAGGTCGNNNNNNGSGNNNSTQTQTVTVTQTQTNN